MAELVAKDQSQGWPSYLDEGEEILWQGRPDPRFHKKPGGTIIAVFGVLAGFSLAWMIAAASAGDAIWRVGLRHLSVGLGLVAGGIYWDSFKRRRSWYALSNRRAFIATDLPGRGRRLKPWPITAESPLTLEIRPPDSVWFAVALKRGKNRIQEVKTGFERIREGRAVWRLFRDMKEGGA